MRCKGVTKALNFGLCPNFYSNNLDDSEQIISWGFPFPHMWKNDQTILKVPSNLGTLQMHKLSIKNSLLPVL